MISVTVSVPTDVIEAINEQIGRTPALMSRAYTRATSRLKGRMLDELRAQPGPPHYPLRWKSDRQRRYVMWLLRSEGNLPYQRTGELAQGWEVNIASSDAGGAITVENAVPYAQYVEGDAAQPFHLDTGWPQAAPIIARYAEEAEEVLIQTWFTVTDIYAGVSPSL